MKKMLSWSFIGFLLFTTFLLSSCYKDNPLIPPSKIALVNPGFETQLVGWQIETLYKGRYGFSSDPNAAITGDYGLNFYASQPGHFPGAAQETPWNGKIYQTITGLADGKYTFKAHADAVGTGMYLWAKGGPLTMDAKMTPIKSNVNELNSLDFEVKGRVAQVGFICIDAGGNPAVLAPYFHADDVELWKK